MKTLKSDSSPHRGINEAHAVNLLNRRARYALQRDRTKVYALTPLGSIPVFGRRADGRAMSVHDINADLLTLKLASDTVCPYAGAHTRLCGRVVPSQSPEVLIMPEYPKLTMAELEAAWLKLTAPQDAGSTCTLLSCALKSTIRTYASKPPHAATYGLTHQ